MKKGTIRMVALGKRPLANAALTSPTVVGQVLHQFQAIASKGKDMNNDTLLTPHEINVLRYIAEGNSNKLIAYALGIGEQTVKNHISKIMVKLKANDRTHAVVLAIRYGWLSAEESAEKRQSANRLLSLLHQKSPKATSLYSQASF